MQAEALITAFLAHIGDPKDAERQADRIQVPVSLSNRTLALLQKKFGYMGAALAKKHMVAFVRRLQASMQAEKAATKSASISVGGPQEAVEAELTVESQYKNPTGSLLRRQSAYRSSINKTRSFGGVIDQKTKAKRYTAIEDRLDSVFKTIEEGDMAERAPGVVFDHERGQLIVDGNVVVEGSHADILKMLVSWMMGNEPDMFKRAIEGIAEGVRSGQYIRQ